MKKICNLIRVAIVNWKSDLGNLLLIIVPLALAFPKINEFVYSRWWLIIIVILIVVGSWGHTNFKKLSVSELKRGLDATQNERDTLRNNLESIPEQVIKGIFKQLKFGYNERITIYRYTDTAFIPVGRFSLNTEYNSTGRKEYPKNIGYIGICWSKGTFEIKNLPSPDENLEVYLEEVNTTSKMPKSTIKKLSMKSRSYYCLNLLNIEHKPIAVIVFESSESYLPVPIEQIDSIINSEYGQFLIKMTETNLPLGR